MTQTLCTGLIDLEAGITGMGVGIQGSIQRRNDSSGGMREVVVFDQKAKYNTEKNLLRKSLLAFLFLLYCKSRTSENVVRFHNLVTI